MTENKYIYFEEIETARKTQTWWVKNKRSEIVLGEIKWYGPWRQYCFFPSSLTIFNRDCLSTIDGFITDRMDERKVNTH